MTIDDYLPAPFFALWFSMCRRLGIDPVHLAKVTYVESGFRYWAENKSTHASGLIQFMPATLQGLGWKKADPRWRVKETDPAFARARAELAAEFRKVDAIGQVAFVEHYFDAYKGFNLKSVSRVYQAVFLPGTLRFGQEDPEEVLSAKGGRLGYVYALNAFFDANNDYKITVAELGLAVDRSCVTAEWEAIARRVGGDTGQASPKTINVASLAGVQQALDLLGYPLKVDGWWGPETQMAVRRFQQDSELQVDGIVGPKTREALRVALEKRMN